MVITIIAANIQRPLPVLPSPGPRPLRELTHLICTALGRRIFESSQLRIGRARIQTSKAEALRSVLLTTALICLL